jgi:hypothetical protein
LQSVYLKTYNVVMDESGFDQGPVVEVQVRSNHLEIPGSRPAKRTAKLEYQPKPAGEDSLATYSAKLISLGTPKEGLQVFVGLIMLCSEDDYVKFATDAEGIRGIARSKRRIVDRTLRDFTNTVRQVDPKSISEIETLSEIASDLTQGLAQAADQYVPEPVTNEVGGKLWHQSNRLVGAMLVLRNRDKQRPEAALIQLGGADAVNATVHRRGQEAEASQALKTGAVNTLETLSSQTIRDLKTAWMGIATLEHVPKGKDYLVEFDFKPETDSIVTTYNLRDGAEKTKGNVTARLIGK